MSNEQVDYSAIKSEAQDVIREATQAFDRLQEMVITSSREAYAQVSANTAQFVRGIDTGKPARFIRHYPIPVTVAAIGIGFVLGSIATRKLD